jgi:hypothetical protein
VVEFIGARALIGWPVMDAIVFACAFYARFRVEWLQATFPRAPHALPTNEPPPHHRAAGIQHTAQPISSIPAVPARVG